MFSLFVKECSWRNVGYLHLELGNQNPLCKLHKIDARHGDNDRKFTNWIWAAIGLPWIKKNINKWINKRTGYARIHFVFIKFYFHLKHLPKDLACIVAFVPNFYKTDCNVQESRLVPTFSSCPSMNTSTLSYSPPQNPPPT